MNHKMQKLVIIQHLDLLSQFSFKGLFEFQTCSFSFFFPALDICKLMNVSEAAESLQLQDRKAAADTHSKPQTFTLMCPQLTDSNPVHRAFFSFYCQCVLTFLCAEQRQVKDRRLQGCQLPASLLMVPWIQAGAAAGTNH